MRKIQIYLLISAYLISIVTANLLLTIYGPIADIPASFILIGFDLTIKDRLQELWQGKKLVLKLGLLILAGSCISWLINSSAGIIAIASFVAFAAAAIGDSLTFSFMYRHNSNWLQRSNGSNIAGSAIDSLVFPTIAFGSLLPVVIAGQFLAKTIGGLFWSLVIYRFIKSQKQITSYAN